MRGFRLAALAAVLAIAADTAGARPFEAPSATLLTVATGTGDDVAAAGVSLTVRGRAANLRAAGAAVDIAAEIGQSAWVAGASVNIDAIVNGSLNAGGAIVVARGRVGADASLAGASVRIDLPVLGDLRAVGAAVAAGPDTVVGRRARLVGAIVNFAGSATGDVRLFGVATTFNGKADGDVTLLGAKVLVGPNAVIGGKLVVLSGSAAEISPSAAIAGPVEEGPPFLGVHMALWIWSLLIAGFLALSAIATGVVLLIILNGVFLAGSAAARWRPFTSVLIGALTLLLVPVGATLVSITVIGLPVGLALLAGLPFLLLAGYACAAVGLASLFFAWRERPFTSLHAFVFLAVGAAGLAAIGFVPIVGSWLVLIVFLAGLGGFTRAFVKRLRLGALEVT